MSYIRSTSNPEGLYIWGTDTHACIMQAGEDKGKIPIKIFNGLIKKYNKTFQNDCVFKGASVSEVFVLAENGKIITLDELDSMDLVKGNYQIQLKYNDVNIVMWPVTWYHISNVD